MALLDLETLKRFERVRLVWRRLGIRLAAPRRRRDPARGARWSDRRDYSPGDDYRAVDWPFCARHDDLLVRQPQAAPDEPLDFLLDCSRGMGLATSGKFEAARKVVAAMAYCALAGSQRVGLTAYADRIVAQLGPVCGKFRAGRVLAMLQGLAPVRQRSDLAAVASTFVQRRQRRGVVVVVSGSHDLAGLRRGLDILRHGGYRPRVVRLYEAREAAPAILGDAEIVDVETGRSWQATVTESDLLRYRQLYKEFCGSLRSYCASRTIDYVELALDLPEEELLLRAVGAGCETLR